MKYKVAKLFSFLTFTSHYIGLEICSMTTYLYINISILSRLPILNLPGVRVVLRILLPSNEVYIICLNL